eukprot:scaffold236799_cov18-Tisochrysis_lutea.AAC.2
MQSRQICARVPGCFHAWFQASAAWVAGRAGAQCHVIWFRASSNNKCAWVMLCLDPRFSCMECMGTRRAMPEFEAAMKNLQVLGHAIFGAVHQLPTCLVGCCANTRPDSRRRASAVAGRFGAHCDFIASAMRNLMQKYVYCGKDLEGL